MLSGNKVDAGREIFAMFRAQQREPKCSIAILSFSKKEVMFIKPKDLTLGSKVRSILKSR